MASQSFLIINNGTVGYNITNLIFSTPSGVSHVANLSNLNGSNNFTGVTFSTTYFLDVGASVSITIDYVYVSASPGTYDGSVTVLTDNTVSDVLNTTIVIGDLGSATLIPSILPNNNEIITAYKEDIISGTSQIIITVGSNGSFIIDRVDGTDIFKNWITPWPIEGIGNNFYVRFTRSELSGSGTYSASPSSEWLILSSTRSVSISASGLPSGVASTGSVKYFIEIAEKSSNSVGPVIATGTYTLQPTGKIAGLNTNMTVLRAEHNNTPTATAGFSILRNGVRQKNQGQLQESLTPWYINGTSTIGDNYSIKINKIEGNAVLNNLNIWIPITETRTWSISTSNKNEYINFKASIAENSNLSVIKTFFTGVLIANSYSPPPPPPPPPPGESGTDFTDPNETTTQDPAPVETITTTVDEQGVVVSITTDEQGNITNVTSGAVPGSPADIDTDSTAGVEGSTAGNPAAGTPDGPDGLNPDTGVGTSISTEADGLAAADGVGMSGVPASAAAAASPAVGGDGSGADGDGCFTENSLVHMADDTYKKIIDVKIGDFVFNHDGSRVNVVKFIEKVVDSQWESLYSPSSMHEPFATINHPLYINRKLSSVDPSKCMDLYPWLGTTEKIDNAIIVNSKGDYAYNLWVDGDGTYNVNGYGTTSIIGDGGFISKTVEKKLLKEEEVFSLIKVFSNKGKYVQYGSYLLNNFLGRFDNYALYKFIAYCIRKDALARKLLLHVAKILGYIMHPKK